jgi:hypothetical protein
VLTIGKVTFSLKLKPWLFVGIAVVLAVAAVLALWQYRRLKVHSAGDMVNVLPTKDAALFFVDVSALRNTGFLEKLASNEVTEDQEYKDFVAATHFNYERDLDRIAGSAQHQSNGSTVYYLALEGRFDWSQLGEYVKTHRGDCARSVCFVPAGNPGWWISYQPIHSNLMGLAYSTDQKAVYGFNVGRQLAPQPVPPGFAWLTIPRSAIAGWRSQPTDEAPGSALSTLGSVLSVPKESTFSLISVGDASSGAELHLDSSLATDAEALELETQLVRATNVIRGTASNKGAAKDTAALANVLASGRFGRSANHVTGTWVVSPAFLEAITQ